MSSVSHTAANVVSHTDAVSVVLVADLAGCTPERSSGLLPSPIRTGVTVTVLILECRNG